MNIQAVRNSRRSVRRQPYGRDRNTRTGGRGRCRLCLHELGARLKTGQVHYSALLYGHGGFVDDILVHKVAEDHFFLCVNASNQEKDFEHIQKHNRFHADVEFVSDRYAQIAIQGPNALATLQRRTSAVLESIKYYWFVDCPVSGVPARIARTGYTGEDGFEIYIPPAEAPRLGGIARSREGIWDPALRFGCAQHVTPGGEDGPLWT